MTTPVWFDITHLIVGFWGQPTLRAFAKELTSLKKAQAGNSAQVQQGG